jgi:flagellar biosynthesis/type III secretory pathway chaperone
MSATPFATIAASGPSAHSASAVASLAETLRAEARLLEDLVSIMNLQRDAVSHDDIDSLDDTVFSTHRVLVTLGESRRRRRSLNALLGGSDDLSLTALDELFEGNVPLEIRSAAVRLTDTAKILQREVEINRRVLRVAIEAGDRLVRVLMGAPLTASISYAPAPATRSGSPGGAILDRRI